VPKFIYAEVMSHSIFVSMAWCFVARRDMFTFNFTVGHFLTEAICWTISSDDKDKEAKNSVKRIKKNEKETKCKKGNVEI
jgi:hypothetical protein